MSMPNPPTLVEAEDAVFDRALSEISNDDMAKIRVQLESQASDNDAKLLVSRLLETDRFEWDGGYLVPQRDADLIVGYTIYVQASSVGEALDKIEKFGKPNTSSRSSAKTTTNAALAGGFLSDFLGADPDLYQWDYRDVVEGSPGWWSAEFSAGDEILHGLWPDGTPYVREVWPLRASPDKLLVSRLLETDRFEWDGGYLVPQRDADLIVGYTIYVQASSVGEALDKIEKFGKPNTSSRSSAKTTTNAALAGGFLSDFLGADPDLYQCDVDVVEGSPGWWSAEFSAGDEILRGFEP